MSNSTVSNKPIPFGKIFSGKTFKQLFPLHTAFYKYLFDNMNQYGFQYKYGLNIDTKRFNPHGSCEGGGLYFTTHDRIEAFKNGKHGNNLHHVIIPDDAMVYVDHEKFKADKIILNKQVTSAYPIIVPDVQPVAQPVVQPPSYRELYPTEPPVYRESENLSHQHDRTKQCCVLS